MTIPAPERWRPGALLTVGGVVASLAVGGIGASLAARGTPATVSTGSLLVTFAVTGVVAAVSRATESGSWARARRDARLVPRASQLEGEAADFHPRTLGLSGILAHLALVLMGLWALVMIVWALLRGAPGWLVLLAPWAVLVLGGPVLALTGRLGPGGVYVTATRVVDVDRGGRAAVALADVDLVVPTAGRLLLGPTRPDAVVAQRTAWIWGRRPRTDVFVVDTSGLYGGSEMLAERVQAALPGR